MFSRYFLVFLGFVAMLVLAMISKLEVRTEITDFLYTDSGSDPAFEATQINARRLQQQIILAINHKNVSPGIALDFVTALQDSLAAIDGVERVWTKQLDDQALRRLVETYSKYQVQLRSLHPEEEIPALFSGQGLNEKAQQIVEALLGPNSGQIKKLVKQDPMLLTLDWFQTLQSGSDQSGAQNDASFVFLQTVASGTDGAAQEDVLRAIDDTFSSLNSEYDDQFRLDKTGIPVFSNVIRAQIQQDIRFVSALSTLLILLIFILAFRSPKALLLSAVLLLTTVSAAVLLTQTVFGFVHGLTLALGITLMGVCIDYFIHALVHGSADNTQTSVYHIRRIWPSLVVGGATTMLGYAALSAAGVPGLKQISVFSASGIAIALLLTRYIIPYAIAQAHITLRPRLGSQHLLRILEKPVSKWLLIAIVGGVFLFGSGGLKWEDKLEMLTPEIEVLKQVDERIRSQISSLEPGRFILTEASDLQLALQRNEALQRVLQLSHGKGELPLYHGVFPWLASESLQARNIQRWNAQLTPAQLSLWGSTIEQQGLVKDAFTPLATSPADWLTLEQVQNSSAWEMLSRQILFLDDRVVILNWLGKHDAEALSEAVTSLPGVRYFSHRESLDQLAREYQNRALWVLMWGLVAIFVLLMWRFRSALPALKVLSPAILALATVLGGWGMAGQALNMLHLIGLLLASAICVDYAVFFYENRGRNLALTFQAITASALTSSASFACLGVANTPALQALAWTVMPGIIVGLLLCPAILKPAQ